MKNQIEITVKSAKYFEYLKSLTSREIFKYIRSLMNSKINCEIHLYHIGIEKILKINNGKIESMHSINWSSFNNQ